MREYHNIRMEFSDIPKMVIVTPIKKIQYTVLENVAGFARLDVYIDGAVTKRRHWDMFICTLGNKLRVSLNVVRVKMPPALSS